MICIRRVHPPIWFHLHNKRTVTILLALQSLGAVKISALLKVWLPGLRECSRLTWGLRPGSCGVLQAGRAAGELGRLGGTWGQPSAQGISLWVRAQVQIRGQADLSWEFKPHVEKKKQQKQSSLSPQIFKHAKPPSSATQIIPSKHAFRKSYTS